MVRDINFQTLGWFWDIYQRGLLDLEPRYQRRSIWNQYYKDYFIDTVLNNFPCPPIFLHRKIETDGTIQYAVVDGKQRLIAVFEFLKGEFPIYEDCTIGSLKGKYFEKLEEDTKKRFWEYRFIVEYLETADEKTIQDIFDRINRNVAKLNRQELRHAKLDGVFITVAEQIADKLNPDFPRIIPSQKKRMKDAEFVGELFLFLEKGPRSYSGDDLDDAFNERDQEWDAESKVVKKFNATYKLIQAIISSPEGKPLNNTRFRNITDFYSLFGAMNILNKKSGLPRKRTIAKRLLAFAKSLEKEKLREKRKILNDYYEAARAASNDAGPRKKRITIIIKVIKGSVRF